MDMYIYIYIYIYITHTFPVAAHPNLGAPSPPSVGRHALRGTVQLYVCMYVCMYVCVYVCVYIYIYNTSTIQI